MGVSRNPFNYLHLVHGYAMKDVHCIAIKELTCFCYHCVNQANWWQCPKKEYIDNWVYHTLVDKEATEAK